MATGTPTTALDAVRDSVAVIRSAEVTQLLAVLDWVVEHTVSGVDPHAVSFGQRPLALGGVGCPVIDEFDAYDLALALGMSSQAGWSYLARALELRYRLPRLYQAVLDQTLPTWKAFRIADSTMALPEAGAAHVDQQLGPVAARVSFAQVDRLVEAALAQFDPETAEAKRREAAENRGVEVHLDQVSTTGTVEVTATLDYADAHDLEHALQTGAAALADAGCPESLDVRRSIALGDLARGQTTLDLSGHDLTIYAHISADSAVGRLENTRTPILVEQIKTWCNTATRVTVKPVIDRHDTISVNAYEIPDRIREAVILRDHHCVFPNCTSPARSCDLDHITPYDPGDPDNEAPPGQTSTANLAPLCRRHHRAKTHSRWRYESTSPGSYTWTTPSGSTFVRDHTGTRPA